MKDKRSDIGWEIQYWYFSMSMGKGKNMRHRWDYIFICLGQYNILCCKIDSHYMVCWQRD